MGHKQDQSTEIRTDNSISEDFVNNNIQIKRSKTWDMQLHWLRDPENQKKFKVIWEKGSKNGADYFTKHHATIHHRNIRLAKRYIRDVQTDLKNYLNMLIISKL